MKQKSSKIETILVEKVLVYNDESSKPGIIKLRDGMGRIKIKALRVVIYQTDGDDLELRFIKSQMFQTLKTFENRLISEYVTNHYAYKLIE